MPDGNEESTQPDHVDGVSVDQLRSIIDRIERLEEERKALASRLEARRYGELKLLERAGAISDLKLQPRYQLTAADVVIAVYVADFSYTENGRAIAEDAKGVETDVFRIKRKFFAACYPDVELRVTKRERRG